MNKKAFGVLTAALLISFSSSAEVSVFDQPALTPSYLQLMGLMEKAYQEKDFKAMEEVSRAGYKLGMEQNLWLYNIGCAQAMQCKTNEALQTLERAFAEGYRDVEHTKKDPDLKCLYQNPRFQNFLTNMVQNPTPPYAPLIPQNQMVSQETTNTIWDIQRTVFFSGIDASSQIKANSASKRIYAGPFSQQILRWEKEGTADTGFPLLYVNRDGNENYLDKSKYPELIFLRYQQAMIQREQHIGAPNSIFYNAHNMLYFPAIGSSGMSVIRPDFKTSLANLYALDQQSVLRQTLLLLANQLYFYSANEDYTEKNGDQFYMNFPISIAVAGKPGVEKKFIEAAIAAVAAMQPSVRDILISKEMLGLTLNHLFRISQKSFTKPEDYLTGAAHPPVFEPDQLDVEKLISNAHALNIYQAIPPTFASVKVSYAQQADSDLNPFRSEVICDTPFCKCMVFRGFSHTRRYTLQARPENKNYKIHWICLQGLPGKVRLTPDPKVPNQVIAEVDYHPIFEQSTPSGKKIKTSRVDIAAISEYMGSYSVPIIFSIYFMPDETREYAPDGKLVSIDYTIPQATFSGKKLQSPRNWKDVFSYDDQGQINGWSRYRGLDCDQYTKQGLKIIERDKLGRPSLVHIPEYLPRIEQEPQTNAGDNSNRKKRVDLAEVDNEVPYKIIYASEKDREGKLIKK